MLNILSEQAYSTTGDLLTFLQDVGSGTFGNDVDNSVIFTQTANIALLSGH